MFVLLSIYKKNYFDNQSFFNLKLNLKASITLIEKTTT